jgi:hypothetical protein
MQNSSFPPLSSQLRRKAKGKSIIGKCLRNHISLFALFGCFLEETERKKGEEFILSFFASYC